MLVIFHLTDTSCVAVANPELNQTEHIYYYLNNVIKDQKYSLFDILRVEIQIKWKGICVDQPKNK